MPRFASHVWLRNAEGGRKVICPSLRACWSFKCDWNRLFLFSTRNPHYARFAHFASPKLAPERSRLPKRADRQWDRAGFAYAGRWSSGALHSNGIEIEERISVSLANSWTGQPVLVCRGQWSIGTTYTTKHVAQCGVRVGFGPGWVHFAFALAVVPCEEAINIDQSVTYRWSCSSCTTCAITNPNR